MMRLDLPEIALWTRGRALGEATTIRGVSTDTRSMHEGDLFVALKGPHHDGHDHVQAARESGASALLVSRQMDIDLPQVVVEDTLTALGDLASAWRAASGARVIGITGSNGKTTVKTLLAAILERCGRTHVSAGNFNNEIGLPLTLLSMPVDTEYAVLEMGAGKPGDIAYLAAIARPDIGLVNTIAPAHLERMGSIEGVAETKGALYEALPADGVAVINADDAWAEFFAGLAGSRRQVRFALEHPAEVSAEVMAMTADGSRFTLHTPQGDADLALPLPGRHNIANALAAAALAYALEVPLDVIRQGLQHVAAVAGRLRSTRTRAGWTLIDDSYNANPASVRAAIETLVLARGERWLVLGDMAELGSGARALHQRVGALAHERGVDRLFGIGPLSRAATDAFGSGATHFTDQAALIDALQEALHADVTCLIKGSRSAAMDRVATALLERAGGGTHHAA